MLKGLALCVCRAGCSFYVWTLSSHFYFFSYLDRIWSDQSSPVLPFEEWPTMQSLARYSLGSGDNVVSMPIALQLKWLTMREMSCAIPFMSIAAHTSHAVWRCFGAHFGLTCLLCHCCVFFGTVVSWGCALPPSPPTQGTYNWHRCSWCNWPLCKRQDIGTLSTVLKPDMHLTLSTFISIDAYTGTHKCLSVLIADVVPTISLQRPTHSACIYEYLYPLSLISLVFFLNIYF